MKWIGYIAGVLCVGLVSFFSASMGAVSANGKLVLLEYEPLYSLPTYLTFVGVMMTTVTAVLAAVAVGVGVVGAYTIKEIQNRATLTVAKSETIADETKRAVEEKLSDDALEERIIAFLNNSNKKNVAELEDNFYPEDNEDR